MSTNKYIALLAVILLTFGFSKRNVQDGRWVAPESAKTIKNIVPENMKAASAKNGAAIYAQRCAFCHGDTGKGDGAAAASLNPKPTDFSSALVQDQTDGEIFWKTANGRGLMPKWESILTVEECWDLTNFISSLNTK